MKVEDKQLIEQYQKKLELIRAGSKLNPYETKDDQKKRIERAKKDYKYFVETYFPHYADSECADFHIKFANKVKSNKTIKILQRWGRGLAKSVHSDILIPIWLWINGEFVYLVIVGNNETSGKKLLSDPQAEFDSNPLIVKDFGNQKLSGSWTDGDFRTKDGRFIGKALGMQQSPRGLREGAIRPNLIVCDDLEDQFTSKNPKRQDAIINWIEKDLLKTMDGNTRRYIHPNNDPWPRSIQNQLQVLHPNWEVDIVDAYDPKTYKPAWPQKYSDTYYKEIEDDGILSALAEYNHKHHTEGKIFNDDMIQWGKPPRLKDMEFIVGHWDVAFSGKSDYNAVKVWGVHGRNFWHLKAFVKQCKMNDAVRFMFEYEASLPAGIIVHWRVESQFWNDPVKDAVKDVETEYGRTLNIIQKERPKTNKYDRILTLHPYYQNNRIYHNSDERANNDMQVGIEQLKGIEPGYSTHDDAPDADEQAIKELAVYVRVDNFKPKITARSRFDNDNLF